MKRVILVNKAEQTNVFADHLRAAVKALPDWEVCVWQGTPPPLKDAVVLRVGNTFFLGSDQFLALENQLMRAAAVFTITNDYTSAPPTQVRRALRHLVAKARPVITLTTVPDLDRLTKWKGVWYTQSEYVDWNRASYQDRPRPGQAREGIIYWGALRPDRVPSFERYFGGYPAKLPYSVALSGAHRSRAKWMEMYPNAEWQGRLTLDDCAVWQATIYMEDECQHGEYHSVASRFYEAVGRGLPVLVDYKAMDTFKRADIDVSRCLVDGHKDVAKRLKDWDWKQWVRKQQKTLDRDYFNDVVRQLRSAMRKHL